MHTIDYYDHDGELIESLNLPDVYSIAEVAELSALFINVSNYPIAEAKITCACNSTG